MVNLVSMVHSQGGAKLKSGAENFMQVSGAQVVTPRVVGTQAITCCPLGCSAAEAGLEAKALDPSSKWDTNSVGIMTATELVFIF